MEFFPRQRVPPNPGIDRLYASQLIAADGTTRVSREDQARVKSPQQCSIGLLAWPANPSVLSKSRPPDLLAKMRLIVAYVCIYCTRYLATAPTLEPVDVVRLLEKAHAIGPLLQCDLGFGVACLICAYSLHSLAYLGYLIRVCRL